MTVAKMLVGGDEVTFALGSSAVIPILWTGRKGWGPMSLTAVLIASLAAGCGASPTEPSLAHRQLHPLGLIGPFTCEPGVRPVESAGEWATLSEGLQFAEPPSIDFGSERVALISLGTRPTSGYSVEVADVRHRSGAVVIEAVEVTPGRCVTLQVLTCPGAIVVLPQDRTSIDVEWRAPHPRAGCE